MKNPYTYVPKTFLRYRAIRLNPDEPALYCNRAATYNNLKRFNEAIEDCNMALSLNRSYAKAYIRKGYEFKVTNKHDTDQI